MDNQMTFEDAMKRLAEITEKMEDASQPLAELSSLYKEGLELYKYCRKTLDVTEKELVILSEGSEL